MNHMCNLLSIYSCSSENIKREIISSAYQNNSVSFIRSLKEQYPVMNAWNKWSFIISCSKLTKEERSFFLRNVKKSLRTNDYLENILIEWALKQ